MEYTTKKEILRFKEVVYFIGHLSTQKTQQKNIFFGGI